MVHIIKKVKQFSTSTCVKRQRATDIWIEIRRMWFLAYFEPPEVFRVDEGSKYGSAEFIIYAEVKGIKNHTAQIETPGIVERYHAPLRRAYN